MQPKSRFVRVNSMCDDNYLDEVSCIKMLHFIDIDEFQRSSTEETRIARPAQFQKYPRHVRKALEKNQGVCDYL